MGDFGIHAERYDPPDGKAQKVWADRLCYGTQKDDESTLETAVRRAGDSTRRALREEGFPLDLGLDPAQSQVRNWRDPTQIDLSETETFVWFGHILSDGDAVRDLGGQCVNSSMKPPSAWDVENATSRGNSPGEAVSGQALAAEWILKGLSPDKAETVYILGCRGGILARDVAYGLGKAGFDVEVKFSADKMTVGSGGRILRLDTKGDNLPNNDQWVPMKPEDWKTIRSRDFAP